MPDVEDEPNTKFKKKLFHIPCILTYNSRVWQNPQIIYLKDDPNTKCKQETTQNDSFGYTYHPSNNQIICHNVFS